MRPGEFLLGNRHRDLRSGGPVPVLLAGNIDGAGGGRAARVQAKLIQRMIDPPIERGPAKRA